MQVKRKKIPEKYFCERCEPRAVDAAWAKQKQAKFLSGLLKIRPSDTVKEPQITSETNCFNEESDIQSFQEKEVPSETAEAHVEKEEMQVSEHEIRPKSEEMNKNHVKNDKSKKSVVRQSISRSGSLHEDKENGQVKIKKLTETESVKMKRKSIDQSGFKKVKRNEYSSKFVKVQNKLNDSPNSASIPSSSFSSHKSTISSILAAVAVAGNSDLRGKKIMKNMDCLKLFKTTDGEATEYQVKSGQNARENQVIGEYIGRVMLIDEYRDLWPSNENAHVSYCRLEDNYLDEPVEVCIDSSHIGSVSRFVRKSCTPNAVLKHMIDTSGYVHFMLVTTMSILKGAEVTLPFDLDRISDQRLSYDLSNCVCQCEKKCWLGGSVALVVADIACTKIERKEVEIKEETNSQSRFFK